VTLSTLWLALSWRFGQRRYGPLSDMQWSGTVMPWQLGVSLLMRSTAVLALANQACLRLLLTTELGDILSENGWKASLIEQRLRIFGGLRVFDFFEVQTEVSGWDDQVFHLRHVFYARRRRVAEVLHTAVVESRFGVMTPDAVLAYLDAANVSVGLDGFDEGTLAAE